MILKNIDKLDFLRRFVKRTRESKGCWIWTGAHNSKGYPQIRMRSRTRYTHRVIYEFFNGIIPPGQQVHHRCMNPSCVNPAHLESMTADRNRELQALGVGDAADTDTDNVPF